MNPDLARDVQEIKKLIRDIPDFPKKGILFKDITPLLSNNKGLHLTTKLLADPFRTQKIDHVVGLESRGFLFGTNIAGELGAGFVPVRKPGKLPSETIAIEYELEYGTDKLEIHKDAINPGESVIIHDDIIATGGTAKAATDLVEMLGGNVVGYSFILSLGFLDGKRHLNPVPVEVLVTV